MGKTYKPRGRQGSLDGLCGVYSIINAVSYLGRGKINDDCRRAVFETLVHELDKERGRLAATITGGLTFRELGGLIDTARAYLESELDLFIERKTASRTKPGSLDEFWNLMATHLNENGPGSIILGLEGKHSHWTCVAEMSDKSMRLIDSDGLKTIQRSRSTVKVPKGERQHELWGTQSYFLERIAV